MSEESKDALDRAGTALLLAVRMQAQTALKPNDPQLNNAAYRALLARSRVCLAQADPKGDPHKFGATKTALEALEAIERGDDPLGGISIFKALVESVNGGARDIDFGGRRRQGPKPSADEAFLRAAAVALWEQFPEQRDQLVSQARTVIGIDTSAKLQKLVDNFHQRHDANITNSKTPLSIHLPLIKDLIECRGYQKLKDFV